MLSNTGANLWFARLLINEMARLRHSIYSHFPQADEKFAYNVADGTEARLSGYLVANWMASKKFYGLAMYGLLIINVF